jgi:hypothetical protein
MAIVLKIFCVYFWFYKRCSNINCNEKRQAGKVAESKQRARAERKATKQAKMAVVIAE